MYVMLNYKLFKKNLRGGGAMVPLALPCPPCGCPCVVVPSFDYRKTVIRKQY